MNRTPTEQPSSPERDWVWTSTVASAAAGKISVLAVVETLAMTGIGFWLLLAYGWWWHLLFGLAIAPLFYLRTEESTRGAMEWAIGLFDFLWSEASSYASHRWRFLAAWFVSGLLVFWAVYFPLAWFGVDPFWAAAAAAAAAVAAAGAGAGPGAAAAAAAGAGAVALAGALAVALAGAVAGAVAGTLALALAGAGAAIAVVLLFIPALALWLFMVLMTVRIAAGVWFFFHAPLHALRKVPSNWRHHHFSLDSRHPPEVLPSAEAYEQFRFRFSSITKAIQTGDWVQSVAWGTVGSLLFLPAWIFRYSMKMGAWLWLPFVWLLNTPKGSAKDDDAFVKGESAEFWANLRLVYSFITLGLFTLAPLILATELQARGWTDHALGVIFLFGFAKFWTWTRAGAALLAIISYFACLKIRHHRETGQSNYGEFWIPKLSHLAYVRMGLSLFTLAATLWIVATQIIDWSLVQQAWLSMEFFPA